MVRRTMNGPPMGGLPLLISVLGVMLLTGCRDEEVVDHPPVSVRVRPVVVEDHVPRFRISGVVAARTQSNLSFRIGGRVIERSTEVGTHVEAGDILARLDPKEQQSDVEAAVAAIRAAEARLRQVRSVFERQQALLDQGFTTRRDYDRAEQDLNTARAQLDGARAQHDLAHDQLNQTILRAPSPGVVTVRIVEVGQVVQATETMVVLAQDGPRDVVVNLQESAIGDIGGSIAEVSSAAAPEIRTTGRVREISPVTDVATGTVRVKIGLDRVPPEMLIGSSVIVSPGFAPRRRVIVPATALTSQAGRPAVWIADQTTRRVSLQPISIETFDSSGIVVHDGLRPGDLVVTAGGQFLRPSQEVSFAEETKR